MNREPESRLAEHLYRRPVHRSSLVSMHDVRCLAPCGKGGCVERSTSDELVFPRRGAFIRLGLGLEVFADAGAVLLFRRGERYRIAHPIDGGDECTTLRFAPAVLAEALGEGVRPSSASVGPAGVADATAHAELQLLRARGATGAADELEADERALRLLARAAAALREPASPGDPLRAETVRRLRDAVHGVRALLVRDFASRITLESLGRAVGLSPFHLARAFSRETGTSIHRHRVRLRLRAALERLADGAGDLTALALDLGFASHSHFTDSFRQEYGVPPSSFRRGSGRETARPDEAPAQTLGRRIRVGGAGQGGRRRSSVP